MILPLNAAVAGRTIHLAPESRAHFITPDKRLTPRRSIATTPAFQLIHFSGGIEIAKGGRLGFLRIPQYCRFPGEIAGRRGICGRFRSRVDRFQANCSKWVQQNMPFV
jgi:hypothetical protein